MWPFLDSQDPDACRVGEGHIRVTTKDCFVTSLIAATLEFEWDSLGNAIIFLAAVIAAIVLIMKQMGLVGKKARAIFAEQISNHIAESPTVIQMRTDVDLVLKTQDSITETLKHVSNELNFNSGSTVKDKVFTLVQNQRVIAEEQADLAVRVGQIHRVVMDPIIDLDINNRKYQ